MQRVFSILNNKLTCLCPPTDGSALPSHPLLQNFLIYLGCHPPFYVHRGLAFRSHPPPRARACGQGFVSCIYFINYNERDEIERSHSHFSIQNNSLQRIKKEPFSGSHHGMRYFFQGDDGKKQYHFHRIYLS